MTAVWRQVGIAVFLVLAATAIIISIAQVISAQEGNGGDGGEDVVDKHSCWDHWLCGQHTPVPTQPPPTTPPTGVPFCDRFPLHESCLSATSTPRPPTAVPPTAIPPTRRPAATNTPRPPATIAPAPTNTPRPPITAAPVPTSTPRPNSTNTPRPPASTPTPTPNPGGGGGGGDSGGGGGTRPTNTPVPPPTATTIPLCGTPGHGDRGIHTVSVTMVKKNGDTRWINRIQTCTYRFGVCGAMPRAFTIESHLARVGGGDRFDRVGNHRITVGNESINFGTSTSVQEGG